MQSGEEDTERRTSSSDKKAATLAYCSFEFIPSASKFENNGAGMR